MLNDDLSALFYAKW